MELDSMFRTVVFDSSNETREFRCDICNKYLSVAPILFHKTVGKVCGRCFEAGETKKFPNVTFESQTVYEGIAKYIIFPCSFQAKGCKENLDWTQVSQHEASCNFRDNKCPFGQDDLLLPGIKCEWKGHNQNLFYHLMYRHDAYLRDFLKISMFDSDEPENGILISTFMDIPVVAVLFVTDDAKHISFHLLMDTSFVQCEAHTYDIEVTDRVEKHKIVFPENKVAPLCDRAFTANSLEHGFNLELAGLEGLLKSNCFNFCFKIKSKLSDSLKEKSDHLSVEDNTFFNEVCESCHSILFYPIYRCNRGHNNCGDCQCGKTNCKCGEKILDSWNGVLQNVSKMSLHSCPNREQGCFKLMNFREYKFHLHNCEISSKNCVVAKCKWSGNNRNMLEHLKKEHIMLKLNQAYLIDFQKKTEYGFILLDGKMFVLSIVSSEASLDLKVQCLGVETCKYRFEFAIISGKLKLTCCHYCVPLLYGLDESETPNINYPVKMLSQFLCDKSKTYFKLNIFQ